jgi:ribosomal protein L40E
VSFTGSGFITSDTACSVSSSLLAVSGSCTVTGGGFLYGSFTISSSLSAGDYQVTVVGSPYGDTASHVFAVLPVVTSTSTISTTITQPTYVYTPTTVGQYVYQTSIVSSTITRYGTATTTSTFTSIIPSITGVTYATQIEISTETVSVTSTFNSTIPVLPITTAGPSPFNIGSNTAYTLGAIAVVGVAATVGFLRFVYPRLRRRPTPAETAEAEAAAEGQVAAPAGEAEALAAQAAQIPSVTGPAPPLPTETPAAEAQAMYAFCTTCGAPRDPTATKCRSCGREYETATQESPEVAEETSFKAQQAIDKQEREAAQPEEGPE